MNNREKIVSSFKRTNTDQCFVNEFLVVYDIIFCEIKSLSCKNQYALISKILSLRVEDFE